jgi:hypothetical protein
VCSVGVDSDMRVMFPPVIGGDNQTFRWRPPATGFSAVGEKDSRCLLIGMSVHLYRAPGASQKPNGMWE